jgi:hypothetical protein
MPVKGSRKPRICKCGETRDSEFYAMSRSECKRCACARTSSRTRGRTDLHRTRHLHRAYNWTPEKYDAELAKQNGLCAVCGEPPDETDLQKILVVDHDHKTQRKRGLIHGRCNAILGYARDNPAILLAAAAYLQKHNQVLD